MPSWGALANQEQVNKMKIYCIFVKYKGEDDISIADAWDEFNVDDNEDGYREAVDKQKKKRDVVEVREIAITVDEAKIRKAFEPTGLKGKIK